MDKEENQVKTLNGTETRIVSQAWDKSEYTDMRSVSQARDIPEDADMSIKTLMKPILYAMVVIGAYSGGGQVSSEQEPIRQSTKRKECCILLYRILLLGLFLLILTKNLAAFAYISSDMFEYNGLNTVWVTQGLVWFFIFWRAFTTKYGKQLIAFHTWDTTISKAFAELHLQYPVKQVQLRVKILLIIGIILISFNVVGIGLQFAFTTVIDTLASPFQPKMYMTIIIFFFQLMNSIFWILPNIYAAIIAMILKNAFNMVTKAINDSYKTNSCQVPPNFQKLRILHLQLCTLLGDFDRDLGWYYGTLCVWLVGISCFGLYQILRTTLDTLTLVMYISWVISSLGLLGFGTSYAATVNDEAHAPLDTIYYINVSDVNFEKLAQINLFLSKLTGTQVGFSTCGLLIITKEFILTIAGVFLTYFAVLYTL